MYQLKYKIWGIRRLSFPRIRGQWQRQNLLFAGFLKNQNTYKSGLTFSFLSKEKAFKKINWNFPDYGKLWTYNLNYFDFLNQSEIKKEEGIKLIHDFISQYDDLKDGKEPYPTSLRIMNWIKFISVHNIEDREIDLILGEDTKRLLNNLEYHLLANHLLENGFALLFAGYYFRNLNIYQKAKKILCNQLDEQILNDGAHFELSPMYHQVILLRVLDSINLISNNEWQSDNLSSILHSKAKLMLGWLENITFSNGDIPLVNDAAFGIYPSTSELKAYADNLNIEPLTVNLQDSGYRKIQCNGYELFIDVGQIGPSYQPGHAHADTFNFLFYHNGKPIIVDTGTSTYENSDERTAERSTYSHNTVTIDDLNSSEIWGSFRVADRAEILSLKEEKCKLIASHNGYKKVGTMHTRKWSYFNDKIEIHDILKGNKVKGIAHIHFHPSITIQRNEDVITCDAVSIQFDNAEKILVFDYEYAPEFNKREKSKKLQIHFKNQLTTRIVLN